MYKVKLTARARRELKSISKSYKVTLVSIFKELSNDPLIGKALTREFTGRYSFRVGVHRVIYKVNKKDRIIMVITAGHRSKVYQ